MHLELFLCGCASAVSGQKDGAGLASSEEIPSAGIQTEDGVR